MSVVINLYPPSASRAELRKHLLKSGFSKAKSFLVGPDRSLDLFSWFDQDDYRSFEGVEAAIFETSQEERHEFHAGRLALYTRTRLGASVFDRRKQNEVVKATKKAFGGRFLNDCYGANRYTPLWTDLRTPAGRGIWLLYEQVTDTLDAVSYVLPDEQLASLNPPRRLAFLKMIDPSRILYNALLPFVLAAIECFFRETFVILLRYDENAQKKIRDEKRKIEIADVLAISKGERRIEDAIADQYSFQNLNQIHGALSDWLGIELWPLIRKDAQARRAASDLQSTLSRLVEGRHDVIHRFMFDLTVDRKALLRFFSSARRLIDLLVDHLETERRIAIRPPSSPGF